MTTFINRLLATGRSLNAVEAQLVRLGPEDPRRAALSRQASRLQSRHQDEIVAALRAGVDLSTIEFALAMHGQGVTRDPWSDEPTPAQQLLDLMRRYGAERVVEALAAVNREGADAAGISAAGQCS